MTGLIKSSRVVLPLFLAGLALTTALLLPVAVGASGIEVETGLTAADIPADSPPELGAQAVVLAGPDVQLSSSDAHIPEIAANGTFVAAVYVQNTTVSAKRVKLIASEGTNGWGYSIGVDSVNRQGNTPRLAFNPTTTNTVHVVWSGETEQYIRHTACVLADPLPVCGPVSTIAQTGTSQLRQPDVAVDSTGRVHVVWYDASVNSIKTAYSDDARLSATPLWTPGYQQALTYVLVRQPVIAVTSNDDVHLAFSGEVSSSPNYWVTQYIHRNRNHGSESGSKSWSSASPPAVKDMDDMNNPAIAASGTNVFLTWDNQDAIQPWKFGLVGVKGTNSGGTWGGLLKHITSTNPATDTVAVDKRLSFNSDGSIRHGLRPSLAVTGTNEFAVVWQQQPSTQCGFDIETGETGNASSEIYFASRSENWNDLVGTLANISTTYSVDPDLARDSIGTHIVFMKAAASGCAPVGAYSVYYRGPVTEFSDKIGGGVYLPIIVKNF